MCHSQTIINSIKVCAIILIICAHSVVSQNITITAGSQLNPTCFGMSDGQIMVTANGGVSPYTYNWSSTPAQTTATMTGGMAGAYSVTVTDATTATASASFTLTEPMQLIAVASQTSSSCANGGSATVSATGGVFPFTYMWNTGASIASISNLVAGVYTATVTDGNGCQGIDTAYVINGGFNITMSSTDASSSGATDGSATASPTDTSVSYSYLWSNNETTQSITGLGVGTYTVTVTNSSSCTSMGSVVLDGTNGLNISVAFQKPSCSGGSDGTATVNATGGYPGYTYNWDTTPAQTTGTATGLSAGSYSVTVTDSKTNTATMSFPLSDPAAISSSSTIQPASCGLNDGAGTVYGAGGYPPYTYVWSGGQTTSTAVGLVSGIYMVTITDTKSCTATKTVTVTQSSTLNFNISTSSATCNLDNGMAFTNLSGNPQYNFNWSNSMTSDTVTGLASGFYSLTVTDTSGCSGIDSFSINTSTMLNITTSKTDPLCAGVPNGQVGVASISGGIAPYTYSWSNGLTDSVSLANLSEGNYDLTVTDSKGCIGTTSVSIYDSMGIYFMILQSTPATCGMSDGTASVDSLYGGTAPYSYFWHKKPNTSLQTITDIPVGKHYVVVKDAQGCQLRDSIIVTQVCGEISGTIFNDIDGNGVQDAGEGGLSGVLVTDSISGNYIHSGANGYYNLLLQNSGNHIIIITPPTTQYYCAGNVVLPSTQTFPTAPKYYEVTTDSANRIHTNKHFGLKGAAPPCGKISGMVFHDVNKNGVQDSGEAGLPNILIMCSDGQKFRTGSTGNYFFEVALNAGVTISLYPENLNYYCYGNNQTVQSHPVAPTTYSITLTSGTPLSVDNNFGAYRESAFDVAIVSIRTKAGNRPGFDFRGWMDYKAFGDLSLVSCTLRLTFDPLITFLSASKPPVTVTDTYVEWAFPNGTMPNFDCMSMYFHLDAAATPGTELVWTASYNCDPIDNCDYNNTLTRTVTVLPGFTRSENPAANLNSMESYTMGNDATGIISPTDTTFSYVINFQNTSKDTVFNMQIRDTLPAGFNIKSVSMPFASNKHDFHIIEPNVLVFDFPDIMLPDSTTDFINSYGFVQFNVVAEKPFAPSTIIVNQAHTFQNFSPAHITNVAENSVKDTLTSLNYVVESSQEVFVFPNPSKGKVNVSSRTTINRLIVTDIVGRVVYEDATQGKNLITLSLKSQKPGIYILQVEAGLGLRFIKLYLE